jgi:hypothetical protein
MVLFTALTHHRFMLVACKALCKIRILTSNILSSFSYVEWQARRVSRTLEDVNMSTICRF